MKTLDQIKERINNIQGSAEAFTDFFGFRQEALGMFHPEFYKEEHKHKCPELTEENVRKELVDYLHFAFGKAEDHRGISANRSVAKLSEWAWILDLDELSEFADDDTNYPYYGIPVLKKFAEHFEVDLPWAIERWPDGEPCSPDCEEC